MSFQAYQDNYQPCSFSNPIDILSLLRDENFPRWPPFVAAQNKTISQPESCAQIPDSVDRTSNENPAFLTPKRPAKKKGVVFSQELEQHCPASPKKMETNQIRLSLTRTAKKGILIRKTGVLSCSNLLETNKDLRSSGNGILNCGSDASIVGDIDALKDTKEKLDKPNENTEKERTLIETVELDASETSSISIEDQETIQPKALKEKTSENKDAEAEGKGLNNLSKKSILSTKSQTSKQMSLSDVIAAPEARGLKKNQSLTTSSLVDTASNGVLGANFRPTPKSSSANEIDWRFTGNQVELENEKRRATTAKPFKGFDISGTFGIKRPHHDDKSPTKVPRLNSTNVVSPKQTLLLPDFKTENATFTVNLKSNNNQEAPKKESQMIQKNLSHSNLETKKIHTASNNQVLIKTNPPSTPLQQIRKKISINSQGSHLVQNESNSSNRGHQIIHKEAEGGKKISNNTYYFKDGHQIICYSLKENNFKFIGNESLGLEGIAICKVNEDCVILAGGADNKNKQNKLVSSKAVLLDISKGEKEILSGMPIARYNHGMAVSGKNIYTIGGQTFEGKILKSCYMFDLGSKSWFRMPSLRYERTNPLVFAGSKAGTVYVLGGLDSEGNEVPWIEKFDSQKYSWQLVYNVARLEFYSKDIVFLGSLNGLLDLDTKSSGEVLMLAKSSTSKGGNIRYSLLCFDTEKEILTKKSDFQYETKGDEVFGFVDGRSIYITEKGKLGLMDVYLIDSHIWTQKRFTQIN